MCVAEKFCLVVPLELGCLILGLGTLITSTGLVTSAIALLVLERQCGDCEGHFLKIYPDIVLDFVLPVVVLFGALWMVFSLFLVVGIWKNKASLVLCYFGYGIMLTIVIQLSALLVLLHNQWIFSLLKFIISITYIHCLMAVHTMYDQMQKEQGSHQLDDERFLVEDTWSTTFDDMTEN